jgi:hypothetical protein
MLNISPGLFEKELDIAIPFIKDVVVYDSKTENAQIKSLDIEIAVQIAQTTNGPLSGLNLHISAIKDEALANSIHAGSPSNNLRSLILKEYETQKRQYTNVFLQDHSRAGTTLVINADSGSSIYYRTIKVPMTITYVGDVNYLCLVAVISEAYDPSSTGLRSFKEYFQRREFKISPPSMETVLRIGQPVMSSNIFLLADDVAQYGAIGDAWPSTVHEHPVHGFMTGPTHDEKPHPKISLVTVPNLKTKDYRMSVVNNLIPTDTPQETSPFPHKAYTSPVYFSRSRDNALKMFFSFDFHNFIVDNSALSYAFENKSSLRATAQIQEIKIYRQRVDGEDFGNRLTPSKHVNNTACFDRSTRELVARLSDNSVSIVRAHHQEWDGVYEIVAVDRDIITEGPAAYQYSVEIEIIDNSISQVKQMITRLRELMNEFEPYLLKSFNFEKRNYNIETYMSAMSTFDSSSPVWKAVISEYVASLAFFRGNPIGGNISIPQLTRNLIALVSPTSATHSSLKQFKQQINDFILQLEALTGQSHTLTSRPYSDTTQSYQSAIAGSPALSRRLKYNFVERQLYRNDLESNTGFDYFGDDIQTNELTFDRVSVQQYGTRISKEINKYQVGSVDIATVNKYGFLTPDTLRLPYGDIKVEEGADFSKSLGLLRANKDRVSKNISFAGSPVVAEVKQLDVESLLATAGLSYKRTDGFERLNGLLVRQKSTGTGIIDSSFYLSTTSHFVKADGSGNAPLSEDASLVGNRKLKSVKIPSIETVVAGVTAGFKTATAENIISVSGSYAAAAYASSAQNFSSLNLFEKNIKFNSVVRVEYLVGYENGVRDPTWLLLNQAAINSVLANNKSLLCRLSRPVQGLNMENVYELLMYTSLFTLGPGPLPARDTSIQSTDLISTLKNYINQLMSSGVLNINAAGDSLLSQYTCSDMMIYGTPSTTSPGQWTTFNGGTY